MKALTLIQPWAWAICHAGKRVENRTWAPPPWLIGQRIAIHAGKKPADPDDWAFVLKIHRGAVPDQDLPSGAIVATAILAMVVDMDKDSALDRDEWAFGPLGWVLDEVRLVLPPLPCRGAQGLWDVPRELVSLITT